MADELIDVLDENLVPIGTATRSEAHRLGLWHLALHTAGWFERRHPAARRAGDPNFVEMWNRTGGSERYDRRRRWWMAHHDQFAAALL